MQDVTTLIARYDLEPLPVEGGWFRQTWRSEREIAPGKPAGTAIIALYAAPDGFSAMHRLVTDEVWHFYEGDPFRLLLLEPLGRSRQLTFGAGGVVQAVVPAGTWMGGAVVEGGRWSLMGATMAPGFTSDDFEGGDAATLQDGWPDRGADIASLTRPGTPLHMPPGL